MLVDYGWKATLLMVLRICESPHASRLSLVGFLFWRAITDLYKASTIRSLKHPPWSQLLSFGLVWSALMVYMPGGLVDTRPSGRSSVPYHISSRLMFLTHKATLPCRSVTSITRHWMTADSFRSPVSCSESSVLRTDFIRINLQSIPWPCCYGEQCWTL